MRQAGLNVTQTAHSYAEELDLERLVGRVCSALPVQRLPPPDQRDAFAAQIRRAVSPYSPFTEHVPVRILIGRSSFA